jgi:hypothetical protein
LLRHNHSREVNEVSSVEKIAAKRNGMARLEEETEEEDGGSRQEERVWKRRTDDQDGLL